MMQQQKKEVAINPNIVTLRKYPWYIPAHIALWRQGNKKNILTQIVAMNYSEALLQEQSVDTELLHDFSKNVDELQQQQTRHIEQADQFNPEEYRDTPLDDVINEMMDEMTSEVDGIVQRYLTATQQPQQQQQKVQKKAKTAIELLEQEAAKKQTTNTRKNKESDKIIDRFLQVTELKISPETLDENEEINWQTIDAEPLFAPEDGIVNEELAKIYLDQNHYDQAKEIYNKLYLHYSEKCAYFAKQTQHAQQLKLENQGPNQRGNKAATKGQPKRQARG